MKYLKRIFESNIMLDTNTIGDILQEITDLGYLSTVNTSWRSDDKGNSITIFINGKMDYLTFVNGKKRIKKEAPCIYPDEVIEVVERLIDFLDSEKYTLQGDSKKAIEFIKGRPTEKTKDVISERISEYIAVTMRWDDSIKGYKVFSNIALHFNQ